MDLHDFILLLSVVFLVLFSVVEVAEMISSNEK